MSELSYAANAGQTFMPFRENTRVKTLPFTPLPEPEPRLPELELNPMAEEKGWIIQAQSQHFLSGVTPQMLD